MTQVQQDKKTKEITKKNEDKKVEKEIDILQGILKFPGMIERNVSPVFSIYKNKMNFNSGFCKTYENDLKNNHYVEIYYNKSTRQLIFHFIEKQTSESRKYMKIKNHISISAGQIIKFFDLSHISCEGKHDIICHENNGKKLFIVNF